MAFVRPGGRRRDSRKDEAARGAEANGVGAFLVDGRMIDPFVTRAEAIVSAARRLGLLAAS